MASVISAGTTSNTSLNLSGDTSGVLQLASNGSTTAVTINTSQQVGVGTTSPTAPLDVQSDTGGGAMVVRGRASGDIGTISFYNNANTTQQFFIQSRAAYTQLNTVTNIDMFFATNNTEQMRITSTGLLQFNSGYGSVATAYGCRAWVNFNGTGTPAIRASGNVSSITDNGTGDYTVNFTNAMPDVNYAVAGSTAVTTGGGGYRWLAVGSGQASDFSMTTTSIRVQTVYDATNRTDAEFAAVAIFR